MSKPFTYWVRLAMVATMCTLTTFNPVLAGKCIERLLKREPCKPAACVEVPSCDLGCVVPACPSAPACAPSPVCVPKCPTPVLECPSSCDSLPLGESTMVAPSKPAIDSSTLTVTPETKAVPETKKVEPPQVAPESTSNKADEPKTILPKVETPAVAPPVTPAIAPPVTPDASTPKVETPKEPTPELPKNETATDLFGEPEVKPVTPPAEEPTTDLFGDTAPKTSPPTEEKSNLDDLFNDKPAPAIDPEKPANSSLDDLFGGASQPADKVPETPATDLPPAEKVAEPEMPKDVGDDLFGTEKATEPVIEPATEPATEAPAKSDSLDDLFGSETNKPAEDAKKPATEDSLDSLFGTPNEPSEPAPKSDTSLDDLFGKPVSADTSESPVATDEGDAKHFESLFPSSKSPAESESDETKPKKDAKDGADPLDVLFGVGAFQAPESFQGAEFQTWVDNTGTYSVKARLAVIYSDRVKLMKENGKFTTVPLNRLSERDFGYVQWVANNLSMDPNTKFVKKDSETSSSESIR